MNINVIKNPDDDTIINWVRLIRSHKIGPIAFFELLEIFGNIENALAYIDDLAGQKKHHRLCGKKAAEQELYDTRKYGGEIIIAADARYPGLLRHIDAPPPVLTVIGNIEALSASLVGVVGSRNATINGKKFTKMLVKELGEHDIFAVSGLALGIDSAAHQSAVENNFKTVAVLGSGINVIYPKNNEGLSKKIIEKGGALVSEFAFNETTRPEHFPRRNRIISGLSRGVAIMEASLKSGSLITAKFALEQGRELFVIPGSPFDAQSTGTNKLLKEGATPVTCASDIIRNLQTVIYDDDNLRSPEYHRTEPKINKEELEKLKSEILQRLTCAGTDMDLVFAEFGKKHIVHLALIELEIEDKIRRDSHNNVYLLADELA